MPACWPNMAAKCASTAQYCTAAAHPGTLATPALAPHLIQKALDGLAQCKHKRLCLGDEAAAPHIHALWGIRWSAWSAASAAN